MNRYRFSTVPNLTMVYSDRKATLSVDPRIEELVKAEVLREFGRYEGVSRVFFPEKSIEIPNQTTLTIAVLALEHSFQDRDKTLNLAEKLTQEHGTSARTFKNEIIWAVAETEQTLRDAAQKLLAWEAISIERADLGLDGAQVQLLEQSLRGAKSKLKEAVWSTYNKVLLLDKNNQLRVQDLGRHNSSSASNMVTLIVRELRKYDEIQNTISPNYLVRNWPPAFTEWSTKAIRGAFFASPQFSRLVDPSAIKQTIASGVSNWILGYVGKKSDDQYEPCYFKEPIAAIDVEITDEMYIISRERAEEKCLPEDGNGDGNGEDRDLISITIEPPHAQVQTSGRVTFAIRGFDQHHKPMTVAEAFWATEGGAIGQDGVFVAGETVGTYTVTVTSGELKKTATVIITRSSRR